MNEVRRDSPSTGLVVNHPDCWLPVDHGRDHPHDILLGLDLPLLGGQAGTNFGQPGDDKVVLVPLVLQEVVLLSANRGLILDKLGLKIYFKDFKINMVGKL